MPSYSLKKREYIEPEGKNHKKSAITKRGSTGKSRVFISELHDAIRRAETRRNKRLVDHLVDQAFEDKQILLAVARKILPDLKHVEAVKHTDTDITIRWEAGVVEQQAKLPDIDSPQLTQAENSGRLLPLPADQEVTASAPASSTMSKEELIERIHRAEKEGKISSLAAEFEEILDNSDEPDGTDLDG